MTSGWTTYVGNRLVAPSLRPGGALRIGFSGVPSTGKTTASRALSAALRDYSDHVEYVEEYARLYISKYGAPKCVSEQLFIVESQIQAEMQKSCEVLVTDCPVQLSFVYAQKIYEETRDKKQEMLLSRLYEKLLVVNSTARYDVIFHLPPVGPVIGDGVRKDHHLDLQWREETDSLLTSVLKIIPPKQVHIVRAVSLEDRIDECLSVVKRELGVHNNG